jgi:branched-chain amino acid transport system ATP-binding protein
VIELVDITAGYGGGPVLRKLGLQVGDGQVVALIGPNGAGKTTTLRVASGLLRPSSGTVLVDGRDVAAMRPHQITDLGVCHVPEGRGIFPSLTVRENIVLFSNRGGERDATDRAIEAFPRLGERLGQVAGTLSGGEQQMLALSRAYVQSPSLVLLDEVSMGLAPSIVDVIFEFFENLVGLGVSLLIVEQYVARVLGIADYVYLLTDGAVLISGTPEELASTDLFAAYIGSETVQS